MSDVQAEVAAASDSDEFQPAKFRKLSGKHACDSVAQKHSVKRFKKRRPRLRKSKLVKPTVSSASDFVSSSKRLTRRIGLFSNGKISTKVSRFEYVASAETKARAEQDLHKILNLACNNVSKTVDSDKTQVHHIVDDASTKKCSCHCKSIDEVKENSPMQLASPVNCDVAAASHQNCSAISNSSNKSTETLNSSQTKDLSVLKKHNNNSTQNIQLSSVMSRLHMTLNKKREELFPCISLKNNLKNELAALQRHLSLKRMERSSTERVSCSTLSQENISTPPKETKFSLKPQVASFKLNFRPEFPLYSSPVKDQLFSDSIREDGIFLSEEKYIREEELLGYHGAVFDDSDLLRVSPFKKKSKNCTSLTCASPDSDGEPVWKLHFSPRRPTLESPSSSWNYSRCKMY